MSKSDLIYEVNRLIRDIVFDTGSKASIIGDSAYKGRQIVEDAYKQGRADAIEEVRRGINNIVSEYVISGMIRADLITRYIDSKCDWIKER